MKLFNNEFWCSTAQYYALIALQDIQKGGIASVNGYQPTTGYVKSPVINMSVITAFRLDKLYQRRIDAIEAVTFDEIKRTISGASKLAALSEQQQEEVFNKRKSFLINSMQKTLAGVRDDAHRIAHDRNYARVAPGVKVNFVTEKVNGIETPVLGDDGKPTAQSIMLMVIELKRTYINKGERKPAPNSGVDVLMGNMIETRLPKSYSVKAVSLKSDNFESVHVSKLEITPDDIANDEFKVLEALL